MASKKSTSFSGYGSRGHRYAEPSRRARERHARRTDLVLGGDDAVTLLSPTRTHPKSGPHVKAYQNSEFLISSEPPVLDHL